MQWAGRHTHYGSIRINILGHHGACASACPCADLHRRNQHGIAANKHIVPDFCGMFVFAIIITGDRPGADVDILADVGIANVGEMPHLGTRPHIRILDLAKIAHMDAFGQVSALAQAGKRSHIHAIFQLGLLQHGGEDLAAVADFGIVDDRVGADLTVLADDGAAVQIGIGPDDSIAANLHRSVDIGRGGIDHHHAGFHPGSVDALAIE